MARNKYDVDETIHAPFNKNHFKRAFKYILPYKKNIILTFLVMVISTILGLLGPYIFRIVLDDIIKFKKGINLLILFSCAYLVTQALSAFLSQFRIRLMGKAGQHIIRDLRRDIFVHLQKLPFTYYDDRPHGKILVRVVNYVNTLSDLLSNGIVNMLVDLFRISLILVFMLIIDARLTLISLAGLPFLFVGIFLINTRLRRRHQTLSAKSSNVNAYTHESICGIKVTQSFVREEYNMGIYNKLGLLYKKAWYRMVFTHFAMWPMVEMISINTTCLIYFCSVFVDYFSNGMQVGVFVAFAAYVSGFWAPILNMTHIYNQIINATAYLERIFETIDEPVLVDDIENAIELDSIIGKVEFKNVSFGYEKNVTVLENVNFKVNSGDTIALVGPTGAGKTTIVNLLSRFYNVGSGRILIDDQDISEVTLKSLRRQMGIMLQDPFLYTGSIKDNIRYSKLDATDEAVIEAAKAVNAHEFIMEMADGYNTEVNERGSRLSAGQRQLITFARALLADPRIMILDEATASIDTRTEREVQKGMDRLLEGRTSFIIAHRLSTIKNANCIMYIDKGGIQEFGSHEQLMELKGDYYKLYSSQHLALGA